MASFLASTAQSQIADSRPEEILFVGLITPIWSWSPSIKLTGYYGKVIRSHPPSSMLRPPMRTLTTHAALLAATAGLLTSVRWQWERSKVPIATGRGTPLTRDVSSLDMSRKSMCDSANQGICICRAMKLAAVMRASCSASSEAWRT